MSDSSFTDGVEGEVADSSSRTPDTVCRSCTATKSWIKADRLMSRGEVHRYLALSSEQVQKLINTRQITVIKIQGEERFDSHDLGCGEALPRRVLTLIVAGIRGPPDMREVVDDKFFYDLIGEALPERVLTIMDGGHMRARLR